METDRSKKVTFSGFYIVIVFILMFCVLAVCVCDGVLCRPIMCVVSYYRCKLPACELLLFLPPKELHRRTSVGGYNTENVIY